MPFSDFQPPPALAINDHDAFRAVAERHLPAVCSTAERVLGPHAHLAGDVAQEVFLILARRPPRAASHPAQLGAWLHKLAVRRALNTVRAETRRKQREHRAAREDAMSTPPDPAPGAGWEEMRPHLDAALLELREADRLVLHLRFFEERDLRAIGEMLGLSPAAAQKRLSRGLDRLRARLLRRGVALGAAALSGLLSAHAVHAAPAGLVGQICAASLAAAPAAAAGGVTGFLLAMSPLKATACGLVLGLCAGMAWNALAPAAPTAALVSSPPMPPPPPPLAGQSAAQARFGMPARAASLSALFSQLRGLIREPDHMLTRLRLQGLLDQLKPEEFLPLFGMIRDQCNLTEQGRLYKMLAQTWAKARPEEAMNAVLTVPPQPPRITSGEALGCFVFDTWHENDTQAAREWLVGHSEDELVGERAASEMISTVAKSLLKESPQRLLDWAMMLEGESYIKAALFPLNMAIQGREPSTTKAEIVRAVLDRLNNLSEQKEAIKIITSFVSIAGEDNPNIELALRTAPPTAITWQAALTYLNGGIERADLAFNLAGDETQERAAATIIERTYKAKPELLSWALSKLAGPEKETVIFETARKQLSVETYHTGLGDFAKDRADFVQSIRWAAAMSNPVTRDPLVYGIYQNLRAKMPVQADNILKSPEWASDIKTVLQKAESEFSPTQPQ